MNIDTLLDLVNSIIYNEKEVLNQLFDMISSEAKDIYLEYLSYDKYQLEIYNEFVDPNFIPKTIDSTTVNNLKSESINIQTNTTLSSMSFLSTLSASLTALGLTDVVITALLSVATEILTTAAVITVVLIVACLLAYATHEVIVGNGHIFPQNRIK